MEIGSFLELDLRDTGEYYSGSENITRLNSARAGIYHACRLYSCKTLYIPYYLCPTVGSFLTRKGIILSFYNLDNNFEPIGINQEPDSAVLLVNYFGILPPSHFKKLQKKYFNIIVDNSAAFFSHPITGCYSVYSPRKFFGVPDGAYVIGFKAENYSNEYQLDYSSDTSGFLLQRIEKGSSSSYSERMKNEQRIDNADILRMSKLTYSLLKNIDYRSLKKKRSANFWYAHELFSEINLINPAKKVKRNMAPMVYPLVLENDLIVNKLKHEKIYTGRWWNTVIQMVEMDSFEAWLSKYMIPIPIDHRYGKAEIDYIHMVINNSI